MTATVIHGYLNNKFRRHWNNIRFSKRNLIHANENGSGANILALDSQTRKLFYFKKCQKTSFCLIIDLNNLERCTIKKEYHSIDAGNLKANKLHYFLKSIFLNFKLKNSPGIFSFPFYSSNPKSRHDDNDVIEAEFKAKNWEAVVSQLKPMPIKEIA